MRQESAPDEERSTPLFVEDGSGQEPPVDGNTRRGLLMGVGLAGVAGVLAACGGSGGSDGGYGGSTTDPAQPPASTPGGSAPAAKSLAKTSDIPVGGGKIFEAEKVVVTQPEAGQFHAFSAVCQHAGCTVGSVSGGTINCPCHGSKYKITDASVVAGPAPRPLPAKTIDIQGGEITLA
jgi:nitrite reductase/ring-hydroxylating ferredoxin subunit